MKVGIIGLFEPSVELVALKGNLTEPIDPLKAVSRSTHCPKRRYSRQSSP